jgi:uncharacterized membrane protein YwaF
MEQLERETGDWPMGNILWFAVVIWFSSSLLSQSAYMAINGLPYDSISMLKTLGPVYYLVVLVELAMWAGVLLLGWMKIAKSRKTRRAPPVVSS